MMYKFTQIALVASLLVLPTFGAVLPTQRLAARSDLDPVTLDAREPRSTGGRGGTRSANVMRVQQAARRLANVMPFAFRKAQANQSGTNIFQRIRAIAERVSNARRMRLRPRDLEDVEGLYARDMDNELEARSFDDLEDLYIRSLYDAVDDLEARSLSEFEDLEARELEYGLDELD